MGAAESGDVARLRALRAHFPALDGQPLALLENAGGSQCTTGCADAVRAYMRDSFVQLTAGYALSDRADTVVARAHVFAETFVGGSGLGRSILGPSTTQLVANLALAYGAVVQAGDNIVITEAAHESNAGPWARLCAARGAELRVWRLDAARFRCPLEGLDDLLDARTRVVAFVHASNLLGHVVDAAEVCRRARRVGARTVVDGVAFAPHRAVDVAAVGCDWYVFSAYKVFGPHMAALWGAHAAQRELVGLNHFFIPDHDVPYKFELGGVCHESCAGWLAVADYLRLLATGQYAAGAGDPADRATVLRAMDTVERLERPLTERLVACVASHPRLRLVGTAQLEGRFPTVALTHTALPPQEVVKRLHGGGVACRSGHMYARRLCEPLGLDPASGVVRISALHYNTLAEIDRAVNLLQQL
jgi:cysteine desulfurase family protein (TIGR01976 family)